MVTKLRAPFNALPDLVFAGRFSGNGPAESRQA
jgi:hypothetical protein